MLHAIALWLESFTVAIKGTRVTVLYHISLTGGSTTWSADVPAFLATQYGTNLMHGPDFFSRCAPPFHNSIRLLAMSLIPSTSTLVHTTFFEERHSQTASEYECEPAPTIAPRLTAGVRRNFYERNNSSSLAVLQGLLNPIDGHSSAIYGVSVTSYQRSKARYQQSCSPNSPGFRGVLHRVGGSWPPGQASC